MTTQLCNAIGGHYENASDYRSFFDQNYRQTLEINDRRENLNDDCKTNLFFGLFFDGTKNNYVLAQQSKTQSNIARLYDSYPGLSVPGVLPKETDWKTNTEKYSHFFKVYVPGVSSPFSQVHDSGKELDEVRGAAFGFKGEARIVWALLQTINNVHRYFIKTPLLSDSEITSLVNKIDLNKERRYKMSQYGFTHKSSFSEDENKNTRQEFEKILRRLHSAVSQHWTDKKTGRPPKIAPGVVQKIHVSIFGFSRGATQARAFTNWLMSLCKLDAYLCGKGDIMTLGGFEVKFDFLGLFDTVASVGFGNSLGNSFLGKMFDGHGAWSDSEDSLRIPPNVPCLHLVAAHELRRSFPLESVSVKQVTPSNCLEIVFPGVHSDLGCGYAPGEQGRGLDPDGADMLTRIPLLTMYRSARLAGVPLKLELAEAGVKKKFKLAPSTIAAYNHIVIHKSAEPIAQCA
jgi:hypothetical protein